MVSKIPIKMDKLKRVLNGNDDTSNDENRGIMSDVGVAFFHTKNYLLMIFCVWMDYVFDIKNKK